MADTPLLPRPAAVNVPATTLVALSTLADHLEAALDVETALEQRNTPDLQDLHADRYEDVHNALSVLDEATGLDGVTRFGADLAQRIVHFMLCEEPREQVNLFETCLRFLDLAICCREAGFGDPALTQSLCRIMDSFDALAPYHAAAMPFDSLGSDDPSPCEYSAAV